MTELLETAPHEFDANLVFTANGLDPFYGFEAVVRRSGGSRRETISFDGEEWSIQLRYSESGIAELRHPSCDLDTIREFHLDFEAQDGIGARSGSFHIAPRTPHMVSESGDEISTPDVVGVNVRVQGANIEFDRYPALLRAAAGCMGINSSYFADENIHEYSNIGDAERYVRIDRVESGALHAVDGAIARLASVCATDRSGYRKHVANDTEAPGYYHTATFDGGRAGEIVDQHRLPKEVKHYLPREAKAFDPDHPLHHPKLGASLQRSLLSGDERTIPWSDLERLDRELDELVLNVLAWDGFPVVGAAVNGEDHPYIADAYFDVDARHRARRVIDDPTPALEQREEHVVIRALADAGGLEDSDFAALEQLVADGGEVSPQGLAEDTGYHLSTIYRVLDRLDDLLEHSYGAVELRSHRVARRVAEAVQHAREAAEDAAVSAARYLEAETGMRIENDRLVDWIDEYDIDISDKEGNRLEIEVGRSVSDRRKISDILREGLRYWRRAGWDINRFRTAKLRYRVNGEIVYCQGPLGGFL
jgi:hypothetical protein